jgi:hypothetical protein
MVQDSSAAPPGGHHASTAPARAWARRLPGRSGRHPGLRRRPTRRSPRRDQARRRASLAEGRRSAADSPRAVMVFLPIFSSWPRRHEPPAQHRPSAAVLEPMPAPAGGRDVDPPRVRLHRGAKLLLDQCLGCQGNVRTCAILCRSATRSSRGAPGLTGSRDVGDMVVSLSSRPERRIAPSYGSSLRIARVEMEMRVPWQTARPQCGCEPAPEIGPVPAAARVRIFST